MWGCHGALERQVWIAIPHEGTAVGCTPLVDSAPSAQRLDRVDGRHCQHVQPVPVHDGQRATLVYPAVWVWNGEDMLTGGYVVAIVHDMDEGRTVWQCHALHLVLNLVKVFFRE